ncbi:type II toxin-antitoxin system HicB family antitoxin [Caballeronia sp. LjRoot29]|uniref:type II toxin-antitoxin system HicB family antitoxin n=1 Tax=Caballeronia sp. LjRoot29 TaxID=3342315 RepID=UPI003F50CF1B
MAIHKDEGNVYGVIVPDIAGCHPWGDTIEQAIHNTREAIESHISTLVECGEEVDLSVTPVEVLVHQPEYAGAVWALVDVDPAKFDTQPERVNISLPRLSLERLAHMLASITKHAADFSRVSRLIPFGKKKKHPHKSTQRTFADSYPKTPPRRSAQTGFFVFDALTKTPFRSPNM